MRRTKSARCSANAGRKKNKSAYFSPFAIYCIFRAAYNGLAAAQYTYGEEIQLGHVDKSYLQPFDWYKKINSCDVEVENRIDVPVEKKYLDYLLTLDEWFFLCRRRCLFTASCGHQGQRE